ncbi:MAG TPA: antibiotic biosynthesis monooxygenase [Roseiflexaceae bacterium]|nr:antibiotic biosynthesis monooxygenase [Roseiflexaceae bacterium]
MTYIIIWQYDIVPSARDIFERIYQGDGDWAALFRQSADYLSTQLLRDLAQPDRYMTLDYWRTAGAFEAFRQGYSAAYEELDRRCAELTVTEVLVGSFERDDY